MRKKRFRVSLMYACLFLVFLSFIDYPFIARVINERNQGQVVVSHEQEMELTGEEEKAEMLMEAKAYNKALAAQTGSPIAEAFGNGTDTETAVDVKYDNLLDGSGNGIIGRIEIPKIHVNLAIYHGTSEEVLQKGAGHLKGTSLPVGGADTHASISAHRGLVNKKMFTNLDELKQGDIFLIHVLDMTLCYRIGNIVTVLPDETEPLGIRTGEDLVTLITCTPYGINNHRLYVEGYRIPYDKKVREEVHIAEGGLRWRDWLWLPISILLIGEMIFLLYRYNK